MQGNVARVAAAVEVHGADVGVIHLGLHGNDLGLVDTWSSTLVPIAEPSKQPFLLQHLLSEISQFLVVGNLLSFGVKFEVIHIALAGAEATTLLAELNTTRSAPASQSLGQLFLSSPTVEAEGTLWTLLGQQAHFVGGSIVSSLLLQRTQPAAYLGPEQV